MMLGITAGGQLSALPPALWTPASLTTVPAIWVNDESAVTDAGSGACSQWNDVSGNAYHFTQGTSANRPLIVESELDGKRIIRFDGTTDDLRATSTAAVDIFKNVAAAHIFGLYKLGVTDGSPTQRAFFWFSRSGSTTSRVTLGAGNSNGTANAPYTGGRRLDSDSFSGPGDSTAYAEAWTMALGALDYSGRIVRLFVNGELAGTTTSAWSAGGNTSNTSSNGVVIGAVDSRSAFFQGDIAELFAGASMPTDDEIDKIFGWAAWKWGLEGLLDAAHPYKSAAPTL